MDMKTLHARFKDDDSPSVEGQIRWLQKQGFPQHHIEQAMLTLYSELERGNVPKKEDGTPVKGGWDLDQALLLTAKTIRTDELRLQVKRLEEFEAKLKAKWEEDRRKEEAILAAAEEERKEREAKKAEEDAASKPKRPWYKRLFSRGDE